MSEEIEKALKWEEETRNQACGEDCVGAPACPVCNNIEVLAQAVRTLRTELQQAREELSESRAQVAAAKAETWDEAARMVRGSGNPGFAVEFEARAAALRGERGA